MQTENTFANKLRQAMKDQDVSVRELGRRLNPDNHDVGRRSVQEYLSTSKPVQPRPERRREFARLLGLDEGEFDDEEPDLVAVLTQALELARAELSVRQSRRAVA